MKQIAERIFPIAADAMKAARFPTRLGRSFRLTLAVWGIVTIGVVLAALAVSLQCDAPVPLTPALSLRERESFSPGREKSLSRRLNLSTEKCLPLLRGEGWGEGNGGVILREYTLEPSTPASVSVAAAADLKFALDEIVVKFTEAHPNIRVQLSYGSSGNFYAQLSQRAPFDIFFSADVLYPKKLMEAGLAEANSKFNYAVGRIVVWVSHGSPLDLPKLGLEALRHPSVRKIAIANPEHAPYGEAAVSAMQKLGVYDAAKDRLVYGENVAQAAQFVESGSADIGIIALSLAVGPALKSKGRYWEVPLDSYPRLEQGGAILSWAINRRAARQFRDFVLSPSGKKILRGYGFFPPPE